MVVILFTIIEKDGNDAKENDLLFDGVRWAVGVWSGMGLEHESIRRYGNLARGGEDRRNSRRRVQAELAGETVRRYC